MVTSAYDVESVDSCVDTADQPKIVTYHLFREERQSARVTGNGSGVHAGQGEVFKQRSVSMLTAPPSVSEVRMSCNCM